MIASQELLSTVFVIELIVNSLDYLDYMPFVWPLTVPFMSHLMCYTKF